MNLINKDLYFSIFTPYSLTTKIIRKIILEQLCAYGNEFIPDYYDCVEPIKKEFDSSNLDKIIDDWEEPFLFKKKGNKIEGDLRMRFGKFTEHSHINIYTNVAKLNIFTVVNFVKNLSIALSSDFSLIYYFTENDIKKYRPIRLVSPLGIKNNIECNYCFGVVPKELYKYIPDLFWITILGPAYVNHFGRENILSSPAPIIEELHEEMIMIQLSEDIMDVKREYQKVNQIKENIKEHLNLNSFYDPLKPEDHQYNVPKFEFYE